MDILRFEFPERKKLRSSVIAQHVIAGGYRGAVCFSCGNASAALAATGIYTVGISPTDALQTDKWWGMGQIHKAWPDLFDATSGHLPIPLLVEVAAVFAAHIKTANPQFLAVGRDGIPVYLPTGSGETLVCLALAFPKINWRPEYNCGRGTEFDARSPMNDLVNLLGEYVE